MKRFLAIVLAVLMSVGTMDAVSLRKIKIVDYSVKSIRPQGLRAINGVIEFKFVNSGRRDVDVREVKGTLYTSDNKVFAIGVCENVLIAKGASTVPVTGVATLGDGVSILELLKRLNFDPKDYTVDISISTANRRGKISRFEKKKIPLTAILGK